VPNGFAALFENQEEPAEDFKQFLVSLADSSSAIITSDLMTFAEEILKAQMIPRLTASNVRKILKSYKFIVPCPHARSLVNILNAAWSVYHDAEFWSDIPQVKSRESVLKELVLKNIEVLEIAQIMED